MEDDDRVPDLPEELAELLSQLGLPDLLDQLRNATTATSGPVQWDLAGRIGRELAAEGDREPTEQERERANEAQRLAEHWLDDAALPAPPDAGRLEIVSRAAWVDAALAGLAPMVEPVATASVRALADTARNQLQPFGIPDADVATLAAFIAPMGATIMGVQTGQVIGQLSRQLLGQHDLGVPTADAAAAYHLAVNVAEAFAGYDLDATEVSVVLALHEGAHRRQYHAVPWLAAHVHGLVGAFAAGTRIDADELLAMSQEVMSGLDTDDPASLQAAMERASAFRLTPTPEQQRVLERLQGVVCLLQAWARREIRRAAEGRLPHLAAIEEVLRRRRATRGAGEELLAGLLGLDLKPPDEGLGDRFVEAVDAAGGADGLQRALGHPENLPDAAELADPSRWLVRMAAGEAIPDDPAALFGTGDAPVEPRGDERRHGDVP